MPQGIRTAGPRVIFKHLAALTLAAAALLASAPAWADPPGRVGRIADAIGAVWMFDTEQGEWVAAQRNHPLTAGDRLSAEGDARAELQIGSATLRLDGGSEIEVTELDDSHVAVHLHRGSLALRLRSNESAREFSVTTSEGRFEPQRAGHYRVDQQDNGSFGGVMAGAMHFEASDSALDINAGQRAEFWNERGITHYSWAALPGDRFAEWVAQQDRQDERDAHRRPYVSPEMTGAEDLDRYGDWDSHPEYGALWLPRQVAVGWAPYRYGHWAFVRPWGWTWVDDAPWGFAPFHYGRWVWWRDRWCWAPGQYVARPVYAPALVAWIGGPNVSIGFNFGIGPSVGWVALSPREVYRPHYHVTNVYINNVNSPYRRWQPPIQPNQPVRTGPIMYTNQGVPGGVTVVSQNVLRERRPIGNAVIAPVDSRTIERWQTQPLQRGAAGAATTARRRTPRPPPAPAARVVAVPGGAVPVVPSAPGGAHARRGDACRRRRNRRHRPRRSATRGRPRADPRAQAPTVESRGDRGLRACQAAATPPPRATFGPAPHPARTTAASRVGSRRRRLRARFRACDPAAVPQRTPRRAFAPRARASAARRAQPGAERRRKHRPGQRRCRPRPPAQSRSATRGHRRTAMPELPTYDDVVAAARRLAGHAHRTPVLRSRTADAELGAELFFKCENFQRMGAFKFRGAFNALSRFDARAAPRRRRRVLVGQPRAGDRARRRAARHAGHDRDAARRAAAKVAATRGYGAEVVLYDRYTEDREAIGARLAERARHDADPALRPPRRDRRPGHGGQGTDRGSRRARRAVRLPRRRRPAQRLRAGGARAVARTARSTASSPRPATTPSSRCARRASCTSTRRRRSPTARRRSTWASSPSRSSGATWTTSSPPATRSWWTRMRFFAERMKMVVEPTGCLGFAAARDGGRLRRASASA